MMLLLHQWRAEWLKLLARKRTYIGFGAFLAMELVILTLFQTKKAGDWYARFITRQGGSFEQYFGALTLGFIVLAFSSAILGSIYLALVSGDIVAKESEDGNLRLLLARPVSRLRLLGVKFATCFCYSLILIQFITWSAFLLGVWVRGWGGGMFAFAPEQGLAELWDWNEGLWRYAACSVLLGLSMATVSSIGFFFSCFRIKPAAATITALSYFFVDWILLRTNIMHSYEYLLLTPYMNSWMKVFIDPIPWALIVKNYSIVAAVNLSLFILGAAWFQSRDLKS